MKRMLKMYPSQEATPDETVADEIESYIRNNYDFIQCKYWGIYPIGNNLTVEVNDFYDESTDTSIQFKSIELPKHKIIELWNDGQTQKVCNIILDSIIND